MVQTRRRPLLQRLKQRGKVHVGKRRRDIETPFADAVCNDAFLSLFSKTIDIQNEEWLPMLSFGGESKWTRNCISCRAPDEAEQRRTLL